MIRQEPIVIFGTGEATRDYCYVGNVVQANILAATTQSANALNKAFNVGLGCKTDLNELFQIIKKTLLVKYPAIQNAEPEYQEARPGDILHSTANIELISKELGFDPKVDIQQGIELALSYYGESLS